MMCEVEGCERAGFACYLTIEDADKDDANGIFCGPHAFENGFCACCGQFWGGIERFDFGNGLCEHCESELDDLEEDMSEFYYEHDHDDH